MLLKPYAERFSALTLTFTKGVVALVVLGAAVLVSGSDAIPSGAFWILFASGALGIGIADTLFFRALRELSPHSVVQLMLLGQVATIGMAVVFLGESLISLEWTGVALVIVGVWVVLSDGRQMNGSGPSPLAVLYGLASVLAMAASVTMAKGALESVDPLVATLIRIAGGMAAVVLIVFVFSHTTERRFHFFWTDWRTAAKFAAIAAFITFGGFFLSLLALKYARLAIANTLLSTEPLFVLLIAAVFLKERPEARRVIGSLISLAGIACISAKSIWS
jgi:drug/metabolite transporter (DMT)-like permease